MQAAQFSLDNVIVRCMTSADVKQVRELHDALLPLVKYPSSFFLQLLIVPGRYCIVAVERDAPSVPIAFLSALLHDAPNTDYRSDREELDHLVDEVLGREASTFGTVIPRRKGGSGIYSPQSQPTTRVPRLELLTLGVEPAYQQSGLARLLVQDMVRRIQSSLPKSSNLAINTNVSETGLSPPSPTTPDTPATPEGLRARDLYFEPIDVNNHLRSKSLITYANVSTTNLPAINFYEHVGLYVLPGVRLDGLYTGQAKSRILSSGCNAHLRATNEGSAGATNGRDAYVVAGLL